MTSFKCAQSYKNFLKITIVYVLSKMQAVISGKHEAVLQCG